MGRTGVVVGIVAALLVIAAAGVAVYFTIFYDGGGSAEKYTYENAAVAADVKECSTIGSDTLRGGGSAVDAAIAGLLCLGVLNPQSSGIGGGHFMVVYHRASSTVDVINARETAPGGASFDMYVGNGGAATRGALAIAVPGEVQGMWLAHQKYGQLPWAQLFEPSIELATKGFEIGAHLAYAISRSENAIQQDPGLRKLFTNTEGELLVAGDTMTRPGLADTYRRIAEGGIDEFYRGSLAVDMIDDIQEMGGIMTLEDLQSYEAHFEEAISVDVGDYKMYTTRAPGGGPVLSLIVNVIEGLEFSPKSLSRDKSVLTHHLIAETFKFAYADRMLLGDPYIANNSDINKVVAQMIDEEYADWVRSNISYDKTHDRDYYISDDRFHSYKLDPYGTTHLSVVDEDGNAVSVTSTVNYYFGCKIVGNRTEIVYNNEMDDFEYPTTEQEKTEFAANPPTNNIAPNKRPQSSTCPSILVDGSSNAKMLIGGSGGKRITTATALSIVNYMWLGDSLSEAIERERIHHQLDLDNTLSYENYTVDGLGNKHFDQEISEKLRDNYGHATQSSSSWAVIQGILREDGQNALKAWSDSRKGGAPDGY